MQVFLYKRRNSLTKPDFRRKYSLAYEGLDKNKDSFILYSLFSYYRRLLVIVSLIMIPKIFIAQYFVLTTTVLVIVIVIGYKRPFKEANRNRLELLDEGFIMLLMYHIFCLTDFVPDLGTKRYIGYSAIGWMFLYLLIFFAVLAYLKIKGLI